MILADINLLVHAYDQESPRHARARQWWEDRLNDTEPVGLAWAAMLGFIRLTTNRQVMRNPWTAAEACAAVQSWLDRPAVTVIHPGDRHATILFGLLSALGAAANLTTDAHLAALAIEHQAELHSTDADFARFSGLRWTNPLG
ncbi:MAG TPA: type II toxin-antitoxin system VapC family toxin [Vicinamibacterales bacterium]|nr:type II toxin-antitoxin system VapC family toxin [Vicinamibacterales bacterium]